ncbi:DUF6077 domain-containing protein [Candidatus Eisenbacteria bacterium]|uniref:DUF6077 domain-containing protein n=1 Tax=Eiseniibacteriota bacterium TaxID=2212470 RepID=A0ABV6YJV1_UNCEI
MGERPRFSEGVFADHGKNRIMVQDPSRTLQDEHLQALARLFLLLLLVPAALLTFWTHIAQLCAITFSIYAVVAVGLIVLAACVILWMHVLRGLPSRLGDEIIPGVTLVLFGLLGAMLSLFTHRPDLDDIHYLPNVVYYLENPSAPMGFDIHFLDAGGDLFRSWYWGTSLPFEYAQGAVAHVAGIDLLTMYYMIMPALFGFAMAVVWFYGISRFSRHSYASVAGAGLIFLSLLLMGERHASFGNFAFNRLFQGKAVLFAIGLPLYAAFTLDFFKSPHMQSWLRLLALATAAIGLSASAAMLLPILAVSLTLAGAFAYRGTVKEQLVRAVGVLCSLIYPGVYAVSILLSRESVVTTELPSAGFYPTTFGGHADYVFGPVLYICAAMTAGLAIFILEKKQRRFVALWIISLAMLLNPWIAKLMISNVAMRSVYWRLFYLLPFPLVVGLVGAGLAVRLQRDGRGRLRVLTTAIGALLVLAHLPSASPSIFRHGTRLGIPGYEVNDLGLARQVLDLAPPSGAMLACPAISHSLPMVTAKYPQMRVRTDGVVAWLSRRGRKDEAIRRLLASDFLGGEGSREGLQSLGWVIEHCPQVRSVVMDRAVAERQGGLITRLLTDVGFSDRRQSRDLVLLARRP